MVPISKRNYKKNFLKKPYNRISTPLSGLNLKVQQTWNMQKLATQRVFIAKKTKNKNFEFVYAFSWSNNHSVDLKVHLTVLKLFEKSFSKLPRSLTLRLRGIYGMACRLILRNNIFINFSSQSSMKACYRAFVCLFIEWISSRFLPFWSLLNLLKIKWHWTTESRFLEIIPEDKNKESPFSSF